MQAVRSEDWPYEGTLSSLSRFGTMNTPSLKTGHERRGKAKVKRNPRTSGPLGQGQTSDVVVYHIDKQDEKYVVPATFYSRKRAPRSTAPQSEEAAAIRQAQHDHKLDLLASVGNNSEVD